MRLTNENPEHTISMTRSDKTKTVRGARMCIRVGNPATAGRSTEPKQVLSADRVEDLYRRWLRLVTDPFIHEALGLSADGSRSAESQGGSPHGASPIDRPRLTLKRGGA